MDAALSFSCHFGRHTNDNTVKNTSATLAQLAEHHFCKVAVLGSSPRGGSVHYSIRIAIQRIFISLPRRKFLLSFLPIFCA